MDNRKKSRYEFIEQLFEEIERIPIDQIVGQYVNLVQRGPHKMGLCPFHADTKLGSFIVTPQKKLWKCFACGDGFAGNGVKFVSLYENISYLEAAFQIAIRYNIISIEEYEYYSSKRWDPGYVRRLEKRFSDKKLEEEKPVRAAAPVIHRVYQLLKECSGLSEEHFKHLSEQRGLPENRILRDYFSFPVNGKRKAAIVSYIIQETGLKKEELMTVPGFFFDKKENRITFSSYRGIGILIRDAMDQIIGIQIRRDTIKEGEMRYRWFSSTFAFYNQKEYEGGCGCGSPCDILFPDGPNPKSCLCLTEGRFKSEVLSQYGNTAISIQGVSTWRGVEPILQKLITQKKISNINLFFDADLLGNYPLILQLEKMVELFKTEFPQFKIRYALWSKKYGKGIDDCILNGYVKKVKFFPAEIVINTCHETWREILKKHKISSVRDLNAEQRKEIVQELQSCNEQKLLLS